MDESLDNKEYFDLKMDELTEYINNHFETLERMLDELIERLKEHTEGER